MKKMKRCFTGILAAAMLLYAFPLTGMAEVRSSGTAEAAENAEAVEQDVELAEGERLIIYDYVENPLYPEEQTDEPENEISSYIESEDVDSTVYNSIDYAETTSEAALSLREGMVAREETVIVYYAMDTLISSSDELGELNDEIFETVWEHTSDAKEGDYIRWNYNSIGTKASISYSSGTGLYYYTLTYTITYKTTADQEAELDDAIETLFEEWDFDSSISKFEKIYAIYDYVCSHVTYDYANLNDSDYDLKYTAYAALINGTSVCQGYALLMYRLLMHEGIDTFVFAGFSSSNVGHGWNIVNIGHNYYYIDATWDSNYYATADYAYFLKGTDDFTGHDDYYYALTDASESITGLVAENAYSSSAEISSALETDDGKESLSLDKGSTDSVDVYFMLYGDVYVDEYYAYATLDGETEDESIATAEITVTDELVTEDYTLVTAAVSVSGISEGTCSVVVGMDDQVNAGYSETYQFDVTVNETDTGLEIVTQPEDQTVSVGDTAEFSVEAQGDTLTYQWQWSGNSGKTWNNSSSTTTGYNTAALLVKAIAARDGYQYRCIVTDGNGNSVTSDAAVLNVDIPLAIKSQPEDQCVTLSEKAVFKVTAEGNDLTYQWQWSGNDGKTWNNSTATTTGYNKAALSVIATAGRNGYMYRCVVTDGNGNSVTSEAAVLTLQEEEIELAITGQPEDQTVALSGTASFTVTAEGNGLTYQWQWSGNGGKTWSNSTATTNGYNKATLNVIATAGRNGYMYRCIVTDKNGESLTSEAVTLTVE